MRRLLAILAAGLSCATLARAQTTSTTLASSTTTTIVTSTSVPAASTTTVVSSTTTITSGAATCAQTSASKGECRQSCCAAFVDGLSADCNADGNCVESEWQKFADQWKKAGLFNLFCQNPDDTNPAVMDAFDGDVSVIKKTFETYDVKGLCQAYLFGCKKAVRKHVRQCADSDRCVACCHSATVRWRRGAVRNLRAKGGGALCNSAIRCLKSATRSGNQCRNQCRRQPTCGQDAFRTCLDGKVNGRDVLRCYSKCANKCSNSDSYTWCLQACQGLSECGPYDDCAANLSSTASPGCLTKEPSDCVAVTTTTTSTSSSTSTSALTTTTSTTTSTSTTSPL